jgi:hypothetical protein
MTKQEVIDYFGSYAKVARALRISPAAVYKWPDELPDRIGFRVELVTKGVFKSNETKVLESINGDS